jgi:type II secretory pathway component GspD/PulD (secretin)
MLTRIAPLFLALHLMPLSSIAADEPTPATQDIALSYVEAAEAYQTLKHDDPDFARLVTRIQVDKNSLSIHRDHPKAAAFAQALARLDQPARQVLLHLVVTEVTKSTGQERVVSRPTVFTQERQPATISLPSSDRDKELKVSITSRSVMPGVKQ